MGREREREREYHRERKLARWGKSIGRERDLPQENADGGTHGVAGGSRVAHD